MDGRTAFPRVSGGIVLDSFSIVSFFTGLLAVLPAGLLGVLGASGSRSASVGGAVLVVWGLTVLVFVSRFAQLGIAGDSEGGLFSSVAGPWSGTLLAALRLLVLWAVWLLPFVAWVLMKGDPGAPAGFSGLGPLPFLPRIPVLLTVWSGIGFVLGFAFVSVAVAAPGFAELFSPGLWRALFAGRLGELFVAISGTFGPPLAVFLLFVPIAAAVAPSSPRAALAAIVPVLLYAVGMVLTLQGKLCGAFAAASLTEEIEPGVGVPVAPEATTATAAAAPAAVSAASAAPAPPQAAATPPPGDPKALHDLWRTRLAAGETEAALAAAKEAIAAGLATGNRGIAAEVFRFHLDRLPDLELDRAALDVLADQLLRDGDVAAAAWTFSQALDSEPADPKAYKGLLKVAAHHLEKAKEPHDAIRVYRFLLQRAPASPLAQHARDLLEDAERKAARPRAPQG
jgi:TolA-binding protein